MRHITGRLASLVRPSMIESVKIRLRNFRAHPPILVYQMGKVGSTTVFESLKVAQLPFPTYQIHFLARESIAEVADLYLSRGHSIPGHLRISKALRRKLDRKVDVYRKGCSARVRCTLPHNFDWLMQ
jgi:hypothetical protein